MTLTAARVSEACNLTVRDVDVRRPPAPLEALALREQACGERMPADL
jgi:hypothetical protein